jgi:hypothetical protein
LQIGIHNVPWLQLRKYSFFPKFSAQNQSFMPISLKS